MEKDSIGLERVNEAARRKFDERKCVFCSHDPFSVNIETRSLKKVPNERPLCLLSRSPSSVSNSSRFIASRSAAFSDHHDFVFIWFFLQLIFIHAWDLGATDKKCYGLTDHGAELTVLSVAQYTYILLDATDIVSRLYAMKYLIMYMVGRHDNVYAFSFYKCIHESCMHL